MTSQPSPSTRARGHSSGDSHRGGAHAAARNQRIVERAEAGETLTSLGAEYAVTRERIRQIVEGGSTLTRQSRKQARTARRERLRDEAVAALQARIREAAAADPDATLTVLADRFGCGPRTVADALDPLEAHRREEERPIPSTEETVILDEMRRIAALHPDRPLTHTLYDDHREQGMVSSARIIQRYGKWSAACAAAGVTAAAPARATYTRRWTETEMLDWVWTYLRWAAEQGNGSASYAKFERWLREQDGAPSAQTIRNTFGGWVRVKQQAIAAHTD